MSVQFIDIDLKFLDLGFGFIIPYVMESGYITLDKFGNIEMWYSRPDFGRGMWDHRSEHGVDLGKINIEKFEGTNFSTMIFTSNGKRA